MLGIIQNDMIQYGMIGHNRGIIPGWNSEQLLILATPKDRI